MKHKEWLFYNTVSQPKPTMQDLAVLAGHRQCFKNSEYSIKESSVDKENHQKSHFFNIIHHVSKKVGPARKA